MHFNKKINLLMKMANTTNTRLADALSVDPSLISRWRTGEREPADDSRYIPLIGEFFAHQARQDFQRVALLELTGYHLEDKNVDEATIASYIIRWLANESKISIESIELLLDSIGNIGETATRYKEMPLPKEETGQLVQAQVFNGKDGLRAATRKILLQAVASDQAHKRLLLYSDERLDWILENQDFLKEWVSLMHLCIQKGTKIKIIHTLSRDSNEMAMAVQQWLPFYMTGAITSYYYPRKRDDMFNHTSFVLEGIAKISSTHVRGESEETINYVYITEPNLVEEAAQSFAVQLNLCKPLVRAFTGKKTRQYIYQQNSFFTMATGNGVGMQSLLLIGMPLNLLNTMLERNKIPEHDRAAILLQQEQRLQLTLSHLEHKKFRLIMSLPRITDVLKGYVPALIPELLTQQPFTYLPMEFHAHLQSLIQLLKAHDNLEIYILPQKYIIQSVQLFAMEDSGVMVFKHHNPKFVFISEQKDIINAVRSYIYQESARIPKRERQKSYVLEKLYEFSNRIEKRAKVRMLP